MNGEHEIRVNGHRFKWELRDVVYAVALLLSIVGIYFGSTGRIDTNSRAVGELRIRNDAQDLKISSMDSNGTHRSHEIDSTQQQMIDYHTKQLDEIHRTLTDIIPKVDKIDANVLWLMGRQMESKQR
jgi:hypothetical protein